MEDYHAIWHHWNKNRAFGLHYSWCHACLSTLYFVCTCIVHFCHKQCLYSASEQKSQLPGFDIFSYIEEKYKESVVGFEDNKHLYSFPKVICCHVT